MNEQVLAGQLVDDAEGFSILGVRPGEAVKDVDLLILEIRRDLGENGVEFLFFHGAVHLAPCDIVVYRRGVHDELIVGAAAGVLPGLYHQRPGGRQGSLSLNLLFEYLTAGTLPVQEKNFVEHSIKIRENA